MMQVNKLTNSTKVLRYIRKNPNAKAKEVAKALKVSVNTVYQATYLAKKKVNGRIASVRTPNAQMSLALFSGSPKKEKLIMTHDNVNHPAHYKTGGIETIDFIEAKSLSYNLGNVVKYITRADYKGNKIEDLKKAQWYLNREVSNLEKSK
jgi:prolyl-tRNA editing enzyme YbaK/EbsC (Cys-tRNA(Pro) deacylase)